MKTRIAADATIMDRVTLGHHVTIGKGALIYPNVTLEDGVAIGPYCIIGEPTQGYYAHEQHEFSATHIGQGSIIRSHSVIYEGVTIGEGFQTGHHVTIREGTRIGIHCSVGTLSDLQGQIKIGDYVRLHSNVHLGQLTTVDDYVWIYPYVVATNDPHPPMGDLVGAHIRPFAQVTTGAILMPGKTVGENALVGAGAVVTKDVPPETVAAGVPAKALGSVRDLRDGAGRPMYPWKDHLKTYRGYPWQEKE
jgi:acetyltransferase-like isoleucine patch superfamily enzyme